MLSYIGGKSKIGKWIIEYYLEDMETYVETFGGMFWCFFNMDLEKFPNFKLIGSYHTGLDLKVYQYPRNFNIYTVKD